jgi:transposase-like protein
VVRFVAEARERGLIDKHDRYMSPERRAELIEELSVPGWNLLELAHKYGITKGAVYDHARRRGYVTPGIPRE